MNATREHYTSIAPNEQRHVAAMCGCTLARDEDGGVRFYQCSTHDAAPALLAAAERALGALAANGAPNC